MKDLCRSSSSAEGSPLPFVLRRRRGEGYWRTWTSSDHVSGTSSPVTTDVWSRVGYRSGPRPPTPDLGPRDGRGGDHGPTRGLRVSSIFVSEITVVLGNRKLVTEVSDPWGRSSNSRTGSVSDPVTPYDTPDVRDHPRFDGGRVSGTGGGARGRGSWRPTSPWTEVVGSSGPGLRPTPPFGGSPSTSERPSTSSTGLETTLSACCNTSFRRKI